MQSTGTPKLEAGKGIRMDNDAAEERLVGSQKIDVGPSSTKRGLEVMLEGSGEAPALLSSSFETKVDVECDGREKRLKTALQDEGRVSSSSQMLTQSRAPGVSHISSASNITPGARRQQQKVEQQPQQDHLQQLNQPTNTDDNNTNHHAAVDMTSLLYTDNIMAACREATAATNETVAEYFREEMRTQNGEMQLRQQKQEGNLSSAAGYLGPSSSSSFTLIHELRQENSELRQTNEVLRQELETIKRQVSHLLSRLGVIRRQPMQQQGILSNYTQMGMLRNFHPGTPNNTDEVDGGAKGPSGGGNIASIFSDQYQTRTSVDPGRVSYSNSFLDQMHQPQPPYHSAPNLQFQQPSTGASAQGFRSTITQQSQQHQPHHSQLPWYLNPNQRTSSQEMSSKINSSPNTESK